MTKKETIYNALGIIEGAVCVSQKNTRDVLMKAIEMIKNAVEEEAKTECSCNHQWEAKEYFEGMSHESDRPSVYIKYECTNCGEVEFRKKT